MTLGTLYGVGVGPGDPELITIKGAAVIAACHHVFAPKSEAGADSVALVIARQHISSQANVHELLFPMTTDRNTLNERWDEAARVVGDVLLAGDDACFLTLGDPLLYSTYIYLLRAVRRRCPEIRAVTIPGVTAFSAVAALANMPIGEGKKPVRIVPAATDLQEIRRALNEQGTLVIMKIGNRIHELLDLLEAHAALDRAVLVARAGLPGQRIETDLARLKHAPADAGYLSILLVPSAETDAGADPS